MTDKKSFYISFLLKCIIPVFALGLILLTLFRVHLLQIIHHDLSVLFPDRDALNTIIIKAFGKGLRYDIIVLSYIMSIPMIGLVIAYISQLKLKVYILFFKIYTITAFALLLLISFIDFPYFKYFWTHPTVTIFNWAGYGGTYGMILQEPSYYIYILSYFICLAIIILACIYLPRWASKGWKCFSLISNRIFQIAMLLIASIALFFGTKGQFSTQPIGMRAGYFTEAFLASDLCFTPAYYFMSTLYSHEIQIDKLMDEKEALSFVQKELKVDTTSSEFKNPISRSIKPDTSKVEKDYNIILVFMESMSNQLMGQTIDGKKLTPFLDSLSQKSYYFENFYSSGVHTNVGVGSTLSGYPSRLATKMMYRQPTLYKGLASTLKGLGYSTRFFIPNEFEYDHMGFFLEENGIDKIYVDKDYPKEAVVNMYGVPDDFLFQFAIKELSEKEKIKEPFFTSILTVSNHPPYVVPQELSDIWNNDELAIVAYADNAIRHFIEEASKQEWYDNTIFVFVGDHGKVVGTQKYNISLSYNHVPLIIYSPSFTDMPETFSQFGGQIDIYPTIMGILNKSYVNNTMGIDLLNDEKRPYMFFSSDTHLACIDDEFLYVLVNLFISTKVVVQTTS